MENKFLKYFDAIDISSNLEKNRIEELFKITFKMVKQKINAIFVEDIRDENSRRIRDHLLFLTSHNMVMVENYMPKPKFTIWPYKKSITSIEINYSNYEYPKANSQSDMRIEYHLKHPHQAGYLRAVGNNCDYLRAINEKYLIPNLEKGRITGTVSTLQL